MNLFKNKKSNTTLIILLPLVLLIFSLIFSSKNSVNNVAELLKDSNKFLPNLPEKYITQVNNTYAKDSTYKYSVGFYNNDVERQLVLINQSPKKVELTNPMNVHVYPTQPEQHKNASNYNSKGYLDYSAKVKPIMYEHENNYSVLEINLPYINIEKIFIKQPNVWKETVLNPYKDTLKIKKESVLVSKTKLYEPLFYKALENYNINYLPNGSNDAEILLNYSQENKATLGKIKSTIPFWNLISNKNAQAYSLIEFYGDKKEEANLLLKNLIEDKQAFSEVFNTEKLATYYALVNLFSNNTIKEIGFEYNSENQKLEPIYLNSNALGELNTYINDLKITDVSFLKTYIEKLAEVSNLDVNTLISSVTDFPNKIKQFNTIDPSVLFKSNVLKHNQLILKKSVNPSTAIKAEFISIDNKDLTVSVKNLSDFPVEIINLNFQKNKVISEVSNTLLLKNQLDTIHFTLPRSFENLFVNKKSKTTGFIFEKNIFDLIISYRVNGSNNLHYTEIVPYQPKQNYTKKEDLFRQPIKSLNLEYLTVDNTNKTINFNSNATINSPLILPKGYIITAKPGVIINIEKGGKIISHSALNLVGEKNNPISIISKDKEGQGLLVVAEGNKSTLTHVNFDWLTNPSHEMWSTTSAVTFYESPVDFDYVKISNNTCEDAINVVRSKFTMTNTYFLNTQSDAFDGDYVTGIINSCIFKNLGNDAIDVSGSSLDISNVKIINAGDKALSAGENSQMKINNVRISNCEIAIAGKDLSIVTAKNINIKNTKLGFTAFQKKPEFGPSNIVINNVKMDSVETKYLIENTSSLMVDGTKIETKQADVKSVMYGVEFGVSSDETRNKKAIK